MAKTNLHKLAELGQSPWLDNIRRSWITSGEMQRMIDLGILGVTANPTIFEKAISGSTDYDDAIRRLVRAGRSVEEILRALIVGDIGDTADLFRPVYERTEARDGYVSIEVAPALAHDTEGTIQEAQGFWDTLQRPNIFVKVPATDEGIPAIEELLYRGINVNITLIFGVDVHKRVMEAYLSAVERRVDKGKDVSRLASVASFFVSRVDTKADKMLQELLDKEQDPERRALIQSLMGTTAINNSKMAYQEFLNTFKGDRWERLKAKGARVQRPLWASTSTKNPAYRDVMYVEELIGPDTVNTMPRETLEAVLDHGVIRGNTLEEDVDGARKVFEDFKAAGIDYDDVVETLEREGVEKFAKSFRDLFSDLESKRDQLVAA